MGYRDNISAIDALSKIRSGYMLLPDIQREFCWEMSDIEKLFESIVDNYPLGYCIFWKTNKSILNAEKPNLYKFVEQYKKGETSNVKDNEVFTDDVDYYIVLGGQQRLTAINIALKGFYSEKRKGRGFAWNNPKSFIKRELYYNLDFNNFANEDQDAEFPSKKFIFLSDDEAKASGHYIKVKDIMQFDNSYKLSKYLSLEEVCRNNDETASELVNLYERLTDDYFNVTLTGSDGLAVSGKGNNAWQAYCAALNILDAHILFSKANILISKFYEVGIDSKRKSLEKHHLFPKVYLKSLNYADTKINLMANYAYIDWKDNMEILDKNPSEYYPIICQGMTKEEIEFMEDENALPHGWGKKNYEDFLVERRKLMAEKIKKGFEKLNK